MSRNKRHIDLPALCDDIRCLLGDHEIELSGEKDIDFGFQMKTIDGAVINIYVTGKIYICGDEDAAKSLLKLFRNKLKSSNVHYI